MFFGFNLAENLFDLALFINQKSHSMIAHISPSHKLFLAVSSVLVRNGAVRISQQMKWQVIFFGKLLMRFFAVQGNTEHIDAAPSKR